MEVDVDASTVWGGASAYNIDDAIEFAIENCERAGASARYVHSEMRSSGYLLPPSEFTECQLTEVSACAVNEEQVNLMSSTGELDISHQYVQISSDEMDQLANEATLSYTRKDIVESPQKYIEVEIYTDEAGRVLASFKNNAGIPLRRVEVQFLTSMGGFSSPNNTAKASVIGDIGELGIDSTIEINVSYLDFPLAMGVGVSLDQVEINLLSVELE
ncbi:MAG: hypothetical protein CMQ38_06660 [Gammaproteobacteria bacterium]|nr:hypothetical protein [Gammaproteobacteria bacterium]